MSATEKDDDVEDTQATSDTVDENEQNEKPPQPTAEEIEKQQEAQLRSKYPGINKPGSSTFLQKRLSKGTKYFDSGDYNMAKAKGAPGGAKPTLAPGQKLILPDQPTGDTIPTPETVLNKKLNLHQSKLASMS